MEAFQICFLQFSQGRNYTLPSQVATPNQCTTNLSCRRHRHHPRPASVCPLSSSSPGKHRDHLCLRHSLTSLHRSLLPCPVNIIKYYHHHHHHNHYYYYPPSSSSMAVKHTNCLLTLKKGSRLSKQSARGNFSVSPTWSTRPSTGCRARSTS